MIRCNDNFGFNNLSCKFRKASLLLVVLIISGINAFGEEPLRYEKEKIWNISSSFGTVLFTAEVNPDLSIFKREFNHQPGISANFSVTRIFSRRLEPGLSLEVTTFRGYANNPDFSANEFQLSLREYVTDPAQYQTFLIVPSYYIRYYFKDVMPPKRKKYYLNCFMEFKIGAAILKTRLSYIDSPDEPALFEKGTGRQQISGLNIQFSVGTGMRLDLDEKWGLLAIIDFNMDNYDCLDALHNYSNEGARLNSKGLYSRFMLGASYTLNTKKKKRTTSYPWRRM